MPLSTRVPELGALELLVSVARTGSLSRAAAEHGISAQAAGSRLAYMERLVGLPLLVRSSAGTGLTISGALLVDWAQDVVDAATVLDAGVTALRTGTGRRLKVAASLTTAEYLVPGWLIALRTERPDLDVSLTVCNSSQVAQGVLGSDVDLGFVEGPVLPAGLRSEVVARDELRVVVAPGHPWAGRSGRAGGPVTADELAATALIQREAGSGTRCTLAAVLAPYAPVAPPLRELSSTMAVKSALAAGTAPAVISSLAVVDDIAEGRLVGVPVDGLDLRRELRAVWRGKQALVE